MLDVSRHYFPLATLEAVIDRMALFNLNTLHLHLSDDQGFRLEMDKHPELTKKGAFRLEGGENYGGFYTKADMRELIAYAARHSIAIVPEIDLPGHTRAILASHPELSCTGKALEVPATFGIFDDVLCLGNDDTLALVSDILDEVAELFPAPYIHIGGDEVPTHRYGACPKCRARMLREHLEDVSALQPWFTRRVSEMVRKHHKTPIAWDEVLVPGANLDKDTVIMAWRGTAEGARAAAAGYRVIMTPNQFTYLSTRQPGQPKRPQETGEETLSIERVLSFDPTAGVADHAKVIGAEAALWTEYVKDLPEIDNQLFPRLPILAELFWSKSPSPELFSIVKERLPQLAASGIGYYLEPPRGLEARSLFLERGSVTLLVPPVYDARIEVMLDDSSPFFYTAPLAFTRTTRVRAATVLGDGRRSTFAEGLFVRGALRPGRPPPTPPLEPGATYSYYEGAFEGVPDFRPQVPIARGHTSVFDLTVARRAEDYAISYRASLAAPRDGVYTFYVTSDDGSRFEIDGELVVDNDGRHAPRERRGQAALGAGLHDVRLGFFQRGFGATLRVEIEGPELPRQELRAPLLMAP